MSWLTNTPANLNKLIVVLAVALAVSLLALMVAPHWQHNLLFLQISRQLAGDQAGCTDEAAQATGLDARSRGMAAYACAAYDRAADILSDASASDPGELSNRYYHVESLLRTGEQALAVKQLADPEVRRLFETRALDQLDENVLALVADAGSTDPKVYYALGRLNSREEPIAAAGYYERGLRLDAARETAQAQLALAFVARQRQEWQPVQEAYQNAVMYADLATLKCDILNEAAGTAMFEANDGERALLWAAQLRDLCPWLPDGWLHLIYFNAYLGRSNQALLWYDEAQETRFAGSAVLEEARDYVLKNQ